MPPDPRASFIATHRFGFGAAPGELRQAAADPRGHVLRQLDPVAESWDGLPGTEEGIELFVARRRALDAQRRELVARLAAEGAQAGRPAADGTAPPAAMPERGPPRGAPPDAMPPRPRAEAMPRPAPGDAARDNSMGGPDFIRPGDVMLADAEARQQRIMATDRPFRERLALHWMNHFTVAGGFVEYFGGPMEREAIRPNMLGRFEDLLIAAVLHPAMIMYLDNRNSMGPNSPAAKGRRGLNENLGREVLELHTLGSDGGYGQADVIALAAMLSGWSVDIRDRPLKPRRARFMPEMHEPGPQTLLGRVYPQQGADQAVAALRDLARSPAAARHVTRRLVQHFCGSEAQAGLQPALEAVYRRTGGDLAAVTRAMIEDDRAWDPAPRKVRPPVELVFGASRIAAQKFVLPRPVGALRAMGQGFWTAPAPKGWPEEDEAWAAPDAIKTRLDWAAETAARAPAGLDARALLDSGFGEAASAETRRAIERAANGRQALTLLLMSPEFQRR
jgi:uncharacterized protein (DUF1800 family)